MTCYQVDRAGENSMPLRRIEQRHVRGGAVQTLRSSQTSRSQRLDSEQLGWSKFVAQCIEKSTSVTTNVEDNARREVTVPLYMPDQRGPECFVDHRQIIIERAIAEEHSALDENIFHGHRWDEQLRA